MGGWKMAPPLPEPMGEIIGVSVSREWKILRDRRPKLWLCRPLEKVVGARTPHFGSVGCCEKPITRNGGEYARRYRSRPELPRL
jgi:hypothetical protein